MSSAIDLQIERLSFTHIEIPRTPIRRTIADTKNAPTSDEMTKLDSHSSPTDRRERKTVDGSEVLASEGSVHIRRYHRKRAADASVQAAHPHEEHPLAAELRETKRADEDAESHQHAAHRLLVAPAVVLVRSIPPTGRSFPREDGRNRCRSQRPSPP